MTEAVPQRRLLQTLPLQIADQMAAAVVDGTYSAGVRLRETELAEGFGVSRATVREALRLLEQRGLVRIQPQRGATVTQLSEKELEDLFEVRASLLATGSRLAAERGSDDDARYLKSLLEELRTALGDIDAYTRVSALMVGTLMSMSNNELLASTIDAFAQRIGRYVRLGLQTEARRRRSLSTWVKIVTAVCQGDGETASEQHRTLALDNRTAALDVFRRSIASKS